jgi:glycosyltransferase involved in cell wall biosynthesis
MEMSGMRVVIVAENASAQFGGEAFDPLHYFRVLRSRNIEAWLVVHSRTQAELQALFPKDCDRMHFVADTWLHKLLWHCGQPIPRRVAEVTTDLLSHLYTQSIQRRIVRQLVCEHKIDVVHEPIPLSPKFPSLMFAVGAPVIIGPLNGGMEFPPAFRSRQSSGVELTIGLGRQFSNFCNRLLPGKLRAQTLLVANERTKQALPAGVQGTVIELVDNGVDLSVWRATATVSKEPSDRVRFVYVGRLVDWKAVDLLLEAFKPVATQTDAVLEIIGDGKLRWELEAQTARLGLTGNVVFAGWLSQEQCAVKMQQADGLVLPSLRECGGAVVLEAMAMGLPVIATNWGGPADYLDSTCGILIDPASREALVHGLTEAMLKLTLSPDLRQRMGRAGQERVRQYFDWERKVDRIIEIYDSTRAASINQCKAFGFPTGN